VRLVLVDAANCIYRAFFALPPLRTADGFPTNALHGFAQMLRKVVREERPTAMAVVFDAPGPGFRQAIYSDYKGTRDAQPEDLTAQFPVARELVLASGIPLIEVPGFEADDVIATLVAHAPPDAQIEIVSTDRDLMQLVSERVRLLDTMRDRRYGPAEVEERFGVPPARVLDVRALVGDTTDNIPGVKGIGEKGAAQLIREFGSLEALLERAAEVSGKRPREALLSQAREARLSKELATLRTDAPGCDDPTQLQLRPPDAARLRELYTRLELRRVLEAFDAETRAAAAGARGGKAARPAPPSAQGAFGFAAPAGGAAAAAVDEAAGEEELVAAERAHAAASAVPAAALVDVAIRVERADDKAALDRLARALAAQPRVAAAFVGLAGTGGLPAEPAGVALATAPDRATYVPLGGALRAGELSEALAPVFAGAERRLVSRDGKRIQSFFAEQGHAPALPAFDVELAGFLLDPAAQCTTPALAAAHLGRRVAAFEDVAGRGAKALAPAALPLDVAAAWAAAEASALFALEAPLAERLERDGLRALYEQVELPLTAVLSSMEREGVRVDEGVLARLGREFGDELARLEVRIYELAGERFQIGSPKQLQAVLFEKLRLPVQRKTKTGYSTDEAVLELLGREHELPAYVLAHRRLSKLRSTYVDALPPLVSPRTGRIHPCFHQTGAATGRLSSSQPNVQNIPIRSEDGVRIREAFVPAEGGQLVSADYSQVELRILAHFSGDESLREAFRTGADVHRRTAAEVAGIAPEAVSGDQRARAKAVNFGIIYGLSAFGLAAQLGIPGAEAQATIDAYFARYRGVKRFVQETMEEARERGYVTTLLGRRRYLPELQSRNRALRQASERMAVNTVIQGTAADLMKKAMVDVHRALRAEGLQARMILQVHDELVFDAPRAELERLGPLVRVHMAGVHALEVPLEVELGTGSNWREAH
jgi:DNA polymerase-1